MAPQVFLCTVRVCVAHVVQDEDLELGVAAWKEVSSSLVSVTSNQPSSRPISLTRLQGRLDGQDVGWMSTVTAGDRVVNRRARFDAAWGKTSDTSE